MKRSTILLCSGSDCRKALRRSDRLQQALSRLPVDVERVGCQKVCKGPVVGLDVDGEWQWFRRMDARKAVQALQEFVDEGTLAKSLKRRRDAKRTGKRRS